MLSGAPWSSPGHGWNSCRLLAFNVTFLVLQLFNSLAHGESQMGKKSDSCPGCFLKPILLPEAVTERGRSSRSGR